MLRKGDFQKLKKKIFCGRVFFRKLQQNRQKSSNQIDVKVRLPIEFLNVEVAKACRGKCL